MSAVIILIIGVILGMPLGWAVFLFLMDRKPKRPPTKDEWKVM